MKSLPSSPSPAGPHGLIMFEKELVGIAVAWKSAGKGLGEELGGGLPGGG